MSKLWQEFSPIEPDLKQVRAILLALLEKAPPFLKKELSLLAEGEGKGLRPALLLTAALDNGLKPALYEAAAAIELLHTASLVHDDILDDAQLRRGSATMNQRFGPQRAVLYGDLLFTTCFQLITTSVSPETAREISKIMTMMVSAEILQNQELFQLPVSLRNCLRKTMGKTAALFSLSLFVGARESGLSKELAETYRRIGYHLGMAFQLQDDLLDFFSHDQEFGKPVFGDICHGIYTLPVFFALKNNPKLGDGILSCRSVENARQMIPTLHSTGAFVVTNKIIEGHYQRSLRLLERIPMGKSKDLLEKIIKKMMERRS